MDSVGDHVALDASGSLALPPMPTQCWRCRYDLSGIDAMRCPECGGPLRLWARDRFLERASIDVVRRLRRGLEVTLVGMGSAASGLLLLAVPLDGVKFGAWVVVWTAFVATLAGSLMLSAADRTMHEHWSERKAIHRTRWTAGFCLAALGLVILMPHLLEAAWIRTTLRPTVSLVGQVLILVLVWLAEVGASMVYIGRLAHRFPDERLARSMEAIGGPLHFGAGVLLFGAAALALLFVAGRRSPEIQRLAVVLFVACGGIGAIAVVPIALGLFWMPKWMFRAWRWLVLIERAVAAQPAKREPR